MGFFYVVLCSIRLFFFHSQLGEYELTSPWFAAGLAAFLLGMLVNVDSDRRLRALRKEEEVKAEEDGGGGGGGGGGGCRHRHYKVTCNGRGGFFLGAVS